MITVAVRINTVKPLIEVGGAIISVVPILVLFWDCIFMSTSPCVFHTSSALDFTTKLYGGAKPQYKNMVKSIALLV